MRRLSSTHVTVLLIAAMLCFAVPATTVAAGIGKVQISNAKGKTAKVKSGKLSVSASVPGTVKTSQQGIVTARTAAPADFYYKFTSNNTTCQAIATAPANRDLVVEQVAVNVYQNPTPGIANNLYLYRDAACSGGQALRAVNPTALGVTDLNFEPGYGLRSGTSLYAKNLGSVNSESFVTGYLVSKGTVPASKPSPNKPGPNAD